VAGEKVAVVYNWADEARFFPGPRDPGLLERLGLGGKLNLLYAGNLGPLQGVETLLHAADRLRDLEEVQLVVAGGGTCEDEIRRLADRLRLPNLRLLGRVPVEEMNALNASVDAMLVHLRDLPLARATIPGKTQVALACGRPLLAGVPGDTAELVMRAGAGLAFAPGDADDLARAVRAFAALPGAEREAMGRRGHDFYRRELSLDVAGARFDTLFREAAAR
jgi:glycosyltransferase involved in cell wall biosynthesis